VAAARCREEEEGEKQPEKRVRVGFYRRAQPVEERERGRGTHGPSPGRRTAPACPRVRGSRSAPTARRGKARGGVVGRRVEGGTELQELGKRPAVAGHARAQRQRSSGTRGRRWRT
jgi:hypothetical protein